MKRLLLLGGGHAHLSMLKGLASEPLPGWEVGLVTPFPRLIYSGMLPGWVAGHYRLGECAISLAALAARAGVGLHLTAATGIDLASNLVVCSDGQRVGFDLLSIDTGPEPALADLAGAMEHALPVRPIEGFVAAWSSIFEQWRKRGGRFEMVIVGGGAAAIELGFAVRARTDIGRASDVCVTLLGRDAAPLPGAAPAARREALKLLNARGIRWLGGCAAKRLESGAVVLESDQEIRFDACLIATGTAAPSWPRASGLATDARGFIRVNGGLRSVSHHQVFAAGDVADLGDRAQKSGVFAVRAGPVLAANLRATCAGRPLCDRLPQRRALCLIGTGDGRALASWGSWSASGRWAWWWKTNIDRRFVRSHSA